MREQDRVHALLQARAMTDKMQTPARPLALSAHARVRQPDRRHEIAAGKLGQHPGVDPVGLAGERRQSLHLLRIGDLDLPARQLEPVVHETRAVHRLDRGADRFAVTIESRRQRVQAISIRRRGAILDRHTLAIEQMEVETLATEIQTGVQHCNGPPFVYRGRAASLRGRPFFMAFLTMEGVSVRLGIGSSCKRSASIALPRRCHRVPPKCTAAAENWLRSCISAEYGGTRVHNRGGS